MADTRRELAALQTLLADNTAGDISAQDARDELISSHPSRVTQADTFANEPATGQVTGDLFFPSDGFFNERYDGSAWKAGGPWFSFTKPINGDFSDVGSPTVSTTKGGIVLSGAAGASAYSYKGRKKTAPATPYTVVAGFLVNAVANTSSKIAEAGLHFSDGTKYSSIFVQLLTTINAAWNVEIDNLTNATTFSASPATASFNRPLAFIFLAVGDNGTNRKYGMSADGQTWQTFYSVSRTTFLTATQVGFHVNPFSMAIDMTLLHWKEYASDILP